MYNSVGLLIWEGASENRTPNISMCELLCPLVDLDLITSLLLEAENLKLHQY